MRILVVHGQQLEHYPPVRNLIDVLTRNGHLVTLITKCNDKPAVPFQKRLRVIRLPDNDNQRSIANAAAYFRKRDMMRTLVKREMTKHDILWTTTDSTVRDLGNTVLGYRHVMQLMELIEDMPAFPGLNRPGLSIKKYAQRAHRVVVPEYNRAHIQKAWWELKELPYVLPNKMSSVNLPEPPEEIRHVLDSLDAETRKIILYQGSFKGDRDLDVFAQATELLNDRYVLYIMGSDTEERRSLCARHPDINYIPFIAPPHHLHITRRAHIGLLPYVPEKVGFNSILNALYCAPNKIFEFSGFGVPMIGNDVPGLTIPFEQHNIGRVRRRGDANEICTLIEEIESSYEQMSRNCRHYFAGIDLDKTVNEILI